MHPKRIDFISAYCDRWCQRCAFTDRCSDYAVKMALAMCDGDFKEAIELAVGAPPPRDAEEERRRDAFLADLVDRDPTEEEIAEVQRQAQATEERVDESPITTLSMTVALLSRRWLEEHHDRVRQHSDPGVVEALEVAGWDSILIASKVSRALRGRDAAQHGLDFDDHPIQNVLNASAKLALILMKRSAIAWDKLAQATDDPDAALVAAHLRALRTQVEEAFPKAWAFKRPGFDRGK